MFRFGYANFGVQYQCLDLGHGAWSNVSVLDSDMWHLEYSIRVGGLVVLMWSIRV